MPLFVIPAKKPDFLKTSEVDQILFRNAFLILNHLANSFRRANTIANGSIKIPRTSCRRAGDGKQARPQAPSKHVHKPSSDQPVPAPSRTDNRLLRNAVLSGIKQLATTLSGAAQKVFAKDFLKEYA